MLLQTLITIAIIFRIPNVSGILYTYFNATDKFDVYKQKYNKKYSTIEKETNSFKSFVNNLNGAAALNATSPDSTIYVMNKYADLDPAEVEARYAINLKTYDKVKDGDHQDLLKSNHGIEINNKNLYDLSKAGKLFEKYIQEHNRNYTQKQDGFVHFYRFLKTLVEKNRKLYEGTDGRELNDKADILKESQEFFY